MFYRVLILLLLFTSLVQADPTLERAHSLFEEGDLEQARAILEDALNQKPEDFKTIRLLGRVHAKAERWQESLDYLERALQKEPDDPIALRVYAVSLLGVGRDEEAWSVMNSAIELHPDDPLLLYNRAWARSAREETLNREGALAAVADLNRSLALSPDVDAFSLRAWFKEVLLKDPVAALADRDQAVLLSPQDASLRLRRAMLYADLGRNEQAIEDLEESIRLGPEQDWRVHAETLLHSLQVPPGSPEAEFRSLVLLEGGEATTLPSPSLANLPELTGPGVLFTPSGLLALTEKGWGFTPWDWISFIKCSPNGYSLGIGPPHFEQELVFQNRATYSYDGREVEHDRPYLLEPAQFEQIVLKSTGLALEEKSGEYRLYQGAGEEPQPPSENVFLPSKHIEILPLSPQVDSEPSPKIKLWPSAVTDSGLYILPEGLMEVDGYSVHRLPWERMDDFRGEPYGTLETGSLRISPRTLEEVETFLAARREAIKAAGLRATGLEPTPFEPSGQTALTVQAHRYPLSAKSKWSGLPLSLLGETPWSNGLYLLPQGLVSVEDLRIVTVPWRDVRRLEVTPLSESQVAVNVLLERDTHPLPGGGMFGEGGIISNEEAMRKVLSGYLSIDEDGAVMGLKENPPEQRQEFPYVVD